MHLDEVETLLKEKGIHFLALNETKIDENYVDEALKIEGSNFLGRTEIAMEEALLSTVKMHLNVIGDLIFPTLASK